tara:strand:+ start:882 stop:1280 length:399 start_codon:yes stop_codon:yes gene_type:complete
MFGFGGLESKTKKVLLELFDYPISIYKKDLFKALCDQGKALNQNEYSVAFMYMLVNMNSLVAPFETEDGAIDPKELHEDESEEQQVKDFINLHMSTILQHIHLANTPESEIKLMINEILENAGMLENENSAY